MSLSQFLQSRQILDYIQGKHPDEVRTYILEQGSTWFDAHADEIAVIEQNLHKLNIVFSNDLLVEIKHHLILHYYEKIVPLCCTPQQYCTFLRTAVDASAAVSSIRDALQNGSSVLIAFAHFGGVELTVPVFSMNSLPVNTALRFTTEQFSQAAHTHAEKMAASGYFSPIRFIEIGKPGTMTALDMAAALRRQELLLTVFDEKTEYSVPVKLFGKEVWGGAGLDRLLHFSKAKVVVFNAFMIRTGQQRYYLKLVDVDIHPQRVIQSMYSNLEDIVEDYVAQWYFLHEKIPFVEHVKQESAKRY